LKFKIVTHKPSNASQSDDVLAQVRNQFYRNISLHKKAAEIANNAVSVLGRKVLILIEEIEQYFCLQRYLEHDHRFAFGGGLTEKNRDAIRKGKLKTNPNLFIKEFNEGKVPILIGTSCIQMGSDTKAADFVILLTGGTSEVKIMQSIGRGTRVVPGKTDCIVVDFDIMDDRVCHRHLEERKKLYKTVGEVGWAQL